MKLTNRSQPLIFELSQPDRIGATVHDEMVFSVDPSVCIPHQFLRSKKIQLPEVSELDVVRHFIRLSQKNFCVETHFYPLGSCTMKYNPKVSESIVAWPAWQQSHPYQADNLTQGTLELLWNLEKCFCDLTGMDAFSLHPAAGAQSEFTALLIAKAYFKNKGEHRTCVMIPDSAHGTNPSSATLTGFKTVVISTNSDGYVSVESIEEKLNTSIAVVMITCPNTLGIFEKDIRKIAKIVHKFGALMYLDGANFNAIAGLINPYDLGFDMMHINLHKTFGVPHGGGGPGSGILGVRSDLISYLPSFCVKKIDNQFHLYKNKNTIGQLRAFIGNVGALIRAYVYILLLGYDGLQNMSQTAIINANYIRVKLQQSMQLHVNSVCMHECIFSMSSFRKKYAVKMIDISKRLLDYGFYSPTIYFPTIVPEAMMIEPTETESQQTLDAFIDAILSIIQEIKHDAKIVQSAPHHQSIGRLDEVFAARKLILKWDERNIINEN